MELSIYIIRNSKALCKDCGLYHEKACGIYAIKSKTDRISYKIFVTKEDFLAYLHKNKDKTAVQMEPLFINDKYEEFDKTQVRKVSDEEIQCYLSERY